MLGAGTDLLVVCGEKGNLTGVITKTDVVRQVGNCHGAECTSAVVSAMTVDTLVCRPEDALEAVWAQMHVRGLKNVPVINAVGEPVGVVNARDVLAALLSEATNEEAMMRDYVMGIGYR